MKKAVLLINSFSDGGAEKVVKLLSEKLFEDCSIEVVCLEKKNTYVLDKKIRITYLSNSNHQRSFIKFLIIPFLSYKLYRYILNNDINVVQSHLFRSNYVNILTKILFGSAHIAQVVNHSVIKSF